MSLFNLESWVATSLCHAHVYDLKNFQSGQMYLTVTIVVWAEHCLMHYRQVQTFGRDNPSYFSLN